MFAIRNGTVGKHPLPLSPMTRLAILSDLHGNLPALEAVLADLAQFSVDQIIVAGDVINWGPFSKQVLERVLAGGWAAIRGNNEDYLLDYDTPRAPAAWSDRAQWPLLPWLQRQLRGPAHHRIAAWPDSLSLRFPDGPPIRVVHGAPRSNTQPIYPTSTEAEVTAMLAGVEEPLVIAGHTHLPMDRVVGPWRVLNPGSVGVPVQGVLRASYLLLDSDHASQTWRPTFRQTPIDPAPVLREFERQGFVEECGVIGRLVMAEFVRAELVLHPFLVWRAACCPERPLSLDLLAEFEAVDARPYLPPAYHLAGQPA